MDVYAVESAVARAAEAVRRGEGPYFLELRTYRYRAHSMADPELYRGKDEVAEWKKRDPITTFSARLKADGLLTDAELAAIEKHAWQDVDWAVDAAERGEWEPLEHLERDVHTPAS
jgi:pyruvate dehydrogenase E1 component alpha subunit